MIENYNYDYLSYFLCNISHNSNNFLEIENIKHHHSIFWHKTINLRIYIY